MRFCHRKGCFNRFLPRRHNQRFCLQPLCHVELRRWQAAKRQRRHRSKSQSLAKHAERERQRRIRNATKGDSLSDQPPNETVTESQSSAWSRPKEIPKDFCDRPGCYEPKAVSDRNTAKYCGNACRNAVHRVRQRERNYRTRRYSWPKSPVNYSSSLKTRIPLLHPKKSNHHDSKTSSQPRPRPPPAKK